jgi:hypothetical protein
VETLLEGEFNHLKVLGDELYFVGADELLSLDLSTPDAEPQVVMSLAAVDWLLDYDENFVLYADEDGAMWRAALGANLGAGATEDAESGDAGTSEDGTAADSALADAGAPPVSADAAAAEGLEAATDPGLLLVAERPRDVTLFGDTIYYSDGDTVLSLSVNGGEPTALFPPDSFNFITAVGTDGSVVFFDNKDVLTTVPASGGEPLEIGRAGGDSLFNDTAAFSQYLPGRDIVYWVDDGSGYGWTALDGQSCGLLGSYSSFFDAEAHLTDDYLFVGGDSGLYQVPRVD